MWFPNNNRSRNQTTKHTTPQCCNHSLPTPPPKPVRGTGNKVTAVIAWGKRPVPFRTRKLRPTAPMVLHPGGCGRVGHRRTHIRSRPPNPHRDGGSPTLTPRPPHQNQPSPDHHGRGFPHLTPKRCRRHRKGTPGGSSCLDCAQGSIAITPQRRRHAPRRRADDRR